MTPTEAKAEVFLTAFFSLPHPDQAVFISKLLKHKDLRDDLIDLAIAENRKKEKSRSFSKVAAEIKSHRS